MANAELINRVINDDWQNVIKHVDDNSVDLVLTDPPYGMGYQSNHRKNKYQEICNDKNLDWLPFWIKELKRITKDDAHMYIFCSWHNIDVFKQELSKHFNVKNILIWDKKHTSMGDLEGDYAPSYEMIIFCSNNKRKLNGGRHPNIIRTARTKNENHPTEKPVNLLSFLINKSTQPGELIIDTFAGSFSTAQACVQTNRNYISVEINTSYCDKARTLLDSTMPRLF